MKKTYQVQIVSYHGCGIETIGCFSNKAKATKFAKSYLRSMSPKDRLNYYYEITDVTDDQEMIDVLIESDFLTSEGKVKD